MRTYLKFLPVLIIALCLSCTNTNLIKDKAYRDTIEKSFNGRKMLANAREKELFAVLNKDLSVEQTDGLKFLYAFMPLSDLADYSGDFFLANVDMALLSRSEAAWGKQIPEDIFLHYVLPPRINNENLDSFRIIYYDELKERVRGLNLKEAALEINHWCHEKVIYQPADIRTSAPMSTILSARGRCGEESTFTTAALRTAGIPARQVYTPRWAHNDDNHAWVEIWDNGQWYYLGACEPEPVLDRGWFTEPARRAMLVHTKSFGAPYGNENSINRYNNYTDVNNLSKYAATKELIVRVLNNNGTPVDNASVDYKLYNYAEFYTLASVPTDQNGISRFQTGFGDLLVWASSGNEFDYRKISISETDTLTLTLGSKTSDSFSVELDLNVPPLLTPLTGPSQELIDQNALRIKQEDSIRRNYLNTWIKPEEVKKLADDLSLDEIKTSEIISRSMGNYKEIREFLLETPDSLLNRAVSMLEILADKDLRDTKSEVLKDHLINAKNTSDNQFVEYILNPRIANEILAPWRGYIRNSITKPLLSSAESDPTLIIKYLNENIKIVNEENYYKTPITPVGVLSLKVSDEASRAICFVAICRSLGIPSRLETGRNIPQYYAENIWNDVYFSDQVKPAGNMGYIKLVSGDVAPVPEYYIHFTLARFENGKFNTLDYDFNKKVTDFRDELALPKGNYMLVTGNRLADSRILSELAFFQLDENEHKTIEVSIRKDSSVKKIIGSADMIKILSLFEKNNVTIKGSGDKGSVIIWIEPDKEPTKHIFNDLPKLKGELDKWGGNFLFLTGSETDNNTFSSEKLQGLPAKSYFSTDEKLNLFNSAVKIVPKPEGSLPYVILVDKNGNVIFSSAGYRIGIAELIINQLCFL
jgi:transglutaminase-like putative cysteine protease